MWIWIAVLALLYIIGVIGPLWTLLAGLAFFFIVLPLVALLIGFGAFFQEEIEEDKND
jgi:hypothetical protein